MERTHTPTHAHKPPRKQRRKHVITPTARDDAIFTFLGTYGLASVAQLHRAFWPNAQRQTCLDRLNQLVKAGYLHTMTTNARREEEQVFWIERKASLRFDQSVRAHFIKGKPPTAEVAHTLDMVDTIAFLRTRTQATISGFTHEHQLKSEQRLLHQQEQRQRGRTGGKKPPQVPDARIRLESGGTTREVYIEIDGQYYGKRLRQKIAELGRTGQQILWVVTSPRRLATIRQHAKAFPTIHPILRERL